MSVLVALTGEPDRMGEFKKAVHQHSSQDTRPVCFDRSWTDSQFVAYRLVDITLQRQVQDVSLPGGQGVQAAGGLAPS